MNTEKKILVVDDEAVIRDLLCDILVDDGYPVETTANAPSALEILRNRDDFVLLFTDIMMPDMDGIELIRRARRIRPALIPIVMTGFATIETARAAVKEGAYDYVLKPFSLSEVKLAVAKALERHRLSNENARLHQLTEIFTISHEMANIREESKLHQYVLESALRQVGAERGSLMLLTADGRALEVVASRGLPDEAARARVDVTGCIAGRVAQECRPLLVGDITKHPEVASISRNLAEPSFVSVPLERFEADTPAVVAAQETRGVLAVLNVCAKRDHDAFSEADLKVLDIMARHAAAAIENIRRVREREAGYFATLRLIAELGDARGAGNRASRERVAEVSTMMGQKLGLSREEIEALEQASAIYDIGKVFLESAVYTKNGKLSEGDWEIIKRHPILGYDIVRSAGFLSPGHLAIVRNHHERPDGNGYPDGLAGDDISPVARIMCVADAYVAMTTKRPYREPLPRAQIIEEIRRNSGTQFDPDVAGALVDLIQHGDVA